LSFDFVLFQKAIVVRIESLQVELIAFPTAVAVMIGAVRTAGNRLRAGICRGNPFASVSDSFILANTGRFTKFRVFWGFAKPPTGTGVYE